MYVHNRNTRVNSRVNVNNAGEQATGGGSFHSQISPSGRFVVFESTATNLIPGPTGFNGDLNGIKADVFLHDRVTQTTTLVSVNSDGTQGNEDSISPDLGRARGPALSRDGARQIAFASFASNLVIDDINGKRDVFVHDRCGDTVPGDIDCSGDVDFNDLNILLAGRNEPVNRPEDSRDLDGDGMVTGFDARALFFVCTRPRCATE